MEFKCSGCGGCCRLAGFSKHSKGVLPIKDDMSCGYLIDNKCSIYETRPDICRVSNLGFNYNNLSRKEYYIESTKACHKIIDLLGIDKSYKIDINEYE